jgi:hypothetical protein
VCVDVVDANMMGRLWTTSTTFAARGGFVVASVGSRSAKPTIRKITWRGPMRLPQRRNGTFQCPFMIVGAYNEQTVSNVFF